MQVLDMVVKLDPDIFAIHNGVSIQLPANGSLGGSILDLNIHMRDLDCIPVS